MSTPPPFFHLDGRIINASQIKWAGMRTDDPESDVARVYIEFITGGFTYLQAGTTLDDVRRMMDQALMSAVMFSKQS